MRSRDVSGNEDHKGNDDLKVTVAEDLTFTAARLDDTTTL